MTSRIGVLYQEGRNTVKRRDLDAIGITRAKPAIENFLTELLSLSTLADWKPMAELLRGVPELDAAGEPRMLRPYTQQRLLSGKDRTDRARLDLVLAVDTANAQDAAEIWIEIKAGAGFSGDQISRYRKAIDEAADGIKRSLVVLDTIEHDLEAKLGVNKVESRTWSQLATIADNGSLIWQEVAAFVRERGLDRPPTPRAIDPTVALWLAEAIAPILASRTSWPKWPHGRGVESVRRSLLRHLLRAQEESGRPSVRMWAPGQVTQIAMGVLDDSHNLSIQLAITAAYGIPHEHLRRKTLRSSLPNEWRHGERREDDMIAIASTQIDHLQSPATASNWLNERLQDLVDAGLMLDLDGDASVGQQVQGKK